MKWFMNIPTRTKFLFGYGIVITLLILVIVIGNRGISNVKYSLDDISSIELPNSTDVLKLKSALDEVRVALLTMMAISERSGKERWHQLIRDSTSEADKIMQRLFERNKKQPHIVSRLEELNSVYIDFKQTRDSEIIPLIYDGKTTDARGKAMGIQAQRYDKMRSIVIGLENEMLREAEDHVIEAGEDARKSFVTSLLVGGIAVIISLIMSLLSTRIIARPLSELSEIAERVSSGDLSINTPVGNRSDEVGILSRTFGIMVERLRKEIRDITDAVS
ncbi:MAG TPA: HAMP domain-containing protein, partial [Nitrospirota bacterium]|nr:HAMP domain-containing protein [Nitrospirota bacterium]